MIYQCKSFKVNGRWPIVPLLRHQNRSVRSVMDEEKGPENNRGLMRFLRLASSTEQCSFDGQAQKIQTFDEMSYTAPMSKCYTVLAKDCSGTQRFAVLLKNDGDEAQKEYVS